MNSIICWLMFRKKRLKKTVKFSTPLSVLRSWVMIRVLSNTYSPLKIKVKKSPVPVKFIVDLLTRSVLNSRSDHLNADDRK